MTTVLEHVHNNWPKTDDLLADKRPEWDETKASAVQYATETLWRTYAPAAPAIPIGPTALDTYSEILRQYVADKATIRLIPFARDYYLDGRTAQAIAVTPGGGSGSDATYNKLSALDRLQEILERETERMLPLIIAEVGADQTEVFVTLNVPTVSFHGILDPLARARQR